MVMSKEDTMNRILRAMGLVLTLAIFAGCQPTDAGEAIDPTPAADADTVVTTVATETTAPSQATVASDPPAEFVLLALGDSIPYNSPDDCPGCTGFVDSYGEALEAELGRPVTVLNRSRHDGAGTGQIQEQLQSDEALLAELVDADVVVMSVGFNDGPPFVYAPDGCPLSPSGSASALEWAEAGAATTHECIDSVVQLLRSQVADVYAGIRAAAPGAAIGVLTPYDSWRGWPEFDQVDQSTVSGMYDAVSYYLQTWRLALCEEAEAVGAVCVDVYSAFNGADGTEPPGSHVAADYAHPSQEGNDRIRDLLVEASLTDLLEQ
jgi:lysophospholipase L1-like esterase